jgi:hypothetical protein
MCLHMNRTRVGSSCSKQRKPDTLVWQTGGSGFIGSDGSQGHRWLQQGSPSSGHVTSDQRENKVHDEPKG